MTNKKYQIFVSSTFRDLADERQDAIRNILDLKHIPAGMELFPAADVEQLEYIKRVIDECDYYLLVIGGRYGSVDEGGVSFTEREYDYAVETGKVVIAFVHNNPATIPLGKSETTQEAIDALNSFREKVMDGRLVRMWNTRQDLEPLVLKALIHAFNDLPQQGWIRGDTAASDETLAQANKALQENAELKGKLAELKNKSEPAIEGLANLSSTFSVRCRRKARRSNGSPHYYDEPFGATWADLFVSIAGCLTRPMVDVVIVKGVQALAEDWGLAEVTSMYDADRVTIKAQLLALGLIEARQSKATQGGVQEFLSLTDKGRRLFLEMRVVRDS
ncbi:uncharacterized protein DUF4062 [Salipiger aestuarii]|uniref:Uncharacterized protein DUF4062 n=1 Tax=Salipiger aestuarii TaxID=568098 RepID=A0A327Y8U6_9RHOB|nr:DUF4062 domain-containing protein [Salipiger aestuarii]RAK16921.1 uncharacterized protein DUF4062 [Salipiger aestuarii]